MTMKTNQNISSKSSQGNEQPKKLFEPIVSKPTQKSAFRSIHKHVPIHTSELAEVLFITSYPPRECGIATYSHDLVKAITQKFSHSLSIKICALESGPEDYQYPEEVKYILDTSLPADYTKVALKINNDEGIKIVLIQHEFGFFMEQKQAFLHFLKQLTKPVVVVFHTVLPHPDATLRAEVADIATSCKSIIVMTKTSAKILVEDYGVKKLKINVIAHGTHLVPHLNEELLKMKYGLKGRKVLTTFGLLSAGKSIETTLEALPAIIQTNPEVIFLIIGKTHPEVVRHDGEVYREMLENKVVNLKLQDNVVFINKYLSLTDLLEYLQLTDIYVFTTNDPNQAVSGTFAYAMSCGCPIISTPIPHAKEVLTEDTGIIFDFRNSAQLSASILRLLNDEPLRKSIGLNSLQKIVSTAWENSAVDHAMLFGKMAGNAIAIQFNPPAISMDHLKHMTTDIGMIQFSKINQPDISSGYTLDDNARALVASAMYYKLTGYEEQVYDIHKYLSFIHHCQQADGSFLNYTNEKNQFTEQNSTVNLDDSNGRAIWALGYLVSLHDSLPSAIISEAKAIIEKALPGIVAIHSTRAMAFAIKGLYYYHNITKTDKSLEIIILFADRLVQMYRHESNLKWNWFESYLTYANSVLPEALLFAWLVSGEASYKDIAISTFDFLLSQTFNENGIEVISNKNWLQKGEEARHVGEQPIDVAYTIMTLSKFYDVFADKDYHFKMETAFNWFLGFNRLHQIIYNPCTGGCYDGLEETHVNLNQGAESTVSYLMARLTVEKYRNLDSTQKVQLRKHVRMHTNQSKFIYSTDDKKQQEQPYA